MKKGTVFGIVLICIFLTAIITAIIMHTWQSPNLSAAEALIQKTTQNRATVISHFPSIANIEGFVVTDTQHHRGIIYVDNQGRYLIDGTLIDANGQDTAAQDFYHYLEPTLQSGAMKDLANTVWIAQGSDQAPHKAYIVIDPNCTYCHLAYENLQPLIAKGQLAVRWIVTGIIKPSSPGKALAILTATDPLQALQQNEAAFNTQTESGGIKPIVIQANAPGVDKLTTNLHFTQSNKIIETPTIIYKDGTGNEKVQPGLPTGDALNKLIQSMSAHF